MVLFIIIYIDIVVSRINRNHNEARENESRKKSISTKNRFDILLTKKKKKFTMNNQKRELPDSYSLLKITIVH